MVDSVLISVSPRSARSVRIRGGPFLVELAVAHTLGVNWALFAFRFCRDPHEGGDDARRRLDGAVQAAGHFR
jgi:hypothetical protein